MSAPMMPPQAKKTNPLVWVLAAVLGLFFLAGIVVIGAGYYVVHKVKQAAANPALAVTRMIAAANPDVEVVSIDENKGILTVRDKKTGKTITMNFEDAKNGRFVFKEDGKDAVTVDAGGGGSTGKVEIKTADGVARLGAGGQLPSWLPSYPGADTKGTFSATGNTGETGSFAFTTKDPFDRVLNFYEDGLKKAGLHVTRTVTGSDGKSSGAVLNGEDESKNRTAAVILGASDEGTTVSLTFSAKK
jgi:hypothetical protein